MLVKDILLTGVLISLPLLFVETVMMLMQLPCSLGLAMPTSQ